MMFFSENQVAEFRDSIYKDGFGFTVSVYENEDKTFMVQSDHLLEDNYANFDTFLDDLRIKNPLWFTYYYVRVDKKFKHLVETKLSETVEQVFKWLHTSMMHTQSNWRFEDTGMNSFVQDKIKKEISNGLDFTESGDVEISEAEIELNQIWNGYCPESALKGKRVRMRLNRNDFFESEETGLQVAVFRGVQAIIMKRRGSGDFRSTPEFADEIENGEMLSPQNSEIPPFNDPTIIFEESINITDFINSIKS